MGTAFHAADRRRAERRADLARANLSRVAARSTYLQGSDLTSSTRGGGTIFRYVQLTGATVNGADFVGTLVTSSSPSRCPDGTQVPYAGTQSYLDPPPQGCGPPPPV